MKTAIVTGASSGIGEASAIALAEKGFYVCLTARRENRLAGVSDLIHHKCGADRSVYLAGDVTDPVVRQGVLALALGQWGHVDVLVNNAGTALPGVIEEVNLGDVRQQFETNVLASLAWMQLVGPIMREKRHGRIINMSSVSGRVAFPGLGIYAATKFALEAVSYAARLEYKPWGVQVILIEPGSVVSEIWQRGQESRMMNAAGWQSSPFRAVYGAQIKHAQAMMDGRGPSAATVANAVCRAAISTHPKHCYRVTTESKIGNLISLLPTRLRDWLISRLMKE